MKQGGNNNATNHTELMMPFIPTHSFVIIMPISQETAGKYTLCMNRIFGYSLGNFLTLASCSIRSSFRSKSSRARYFVCFYLWRDVVLDNPWSNVNTTLDKINNCRKGKGDEKEGFKEYSKYPTWMCMLQFVKAIICQLYSVREHE